jgi:hypothetical protein
MGDFPEYVDDLPNLCGSELHVRAWQHHFAAVFGPAALGRVPGFSPAEMALPNHPDVAYAFVRTLNDCGYQWLLVQEHTVELPDGRPLERAQVPHRLVCPSSQDDTGEVVAVVKTQGSDTKLVGQMQPSDEAKRLPPRAGRPRRAAAGHPDRRRRERRGDDERVPPDYVEVVRGCSGSGRPS